LPGGGIRARRGFEGVFPAQYLKIVARVSDWLCEFWRGSLGG
jgi:hypothetical protein